MRNFPRTIPAFAKEAFPIDLVRKQVLDCGIIQLKGDGMDQLPKAYQNFKKNYPIIWQAYDRLGAAVHDSGPLEKKDRELMKLALAIGARLEGAVHSHTRRALEAGASAQEIRHVVLLGVTTLGFPHTVAALTWVEDDLKAGKSVRRKRNSQ
jgi:AhpD family alkylhydroperoxidase